MLKNRLFSSSLSFIISEILYPPFYGGMSLKSHIFKLIFQLFSLLHTVSLKLHLNCEMFTKSSDSKSFNKKPLLQLALTSTICTPAEKLTENGSVGFQMTVTQTNCCINSPLTDRKSCWFDWQLLLST